MHLANHRSSGTNHSTKRPSRCQAALSNSSGSAAPFWVCSRRPFKAPGASVPPWSVAVFLPHLIVLLEAAQVRLASGGGYQSRGVAVAALQSSRPREAHATTVDIGQGVSAHGTPGRGGPIHQRGHLRRRRCPAFQPTIIPDQTDVFVGVQWHRHERGSCDAARRCLDR